MSLSNSPNEEGLSIMVNKHTVGSQILWLLWLFFLLLLHSKCILCTELRAGEMLDLVLTFI